MTRRQWMWLWIWLLLFFIIFCVWNKLETATSITKPQPQTTTTQPLNVVPKKEQKQDLTLKLIKSSDTLKISGVFPSQETVDVLIKALEKDGIKTKRGTIIIDKNAQNPDLLRALPTLAKDLNQFKSGYLEYNAHKVNIDGIVDKAKYKEKINATILTADKGIEINNLTLVEELEITPAPKEGVDEEVQKSTETEISEPTAQQEQKSKEQEEPKHPALTLSTKLEPAKPAVKEISKEPTEKKVTQKKEEATKSQKPTKNAKEQKNAQQELDKLLKHKRVEFIYATEELTPKSKKIVNQVYEVLKKYPNIHIEIAGHTDSDGTKANNLKLSQKRARAIKRYLVKKGIDPKRLKAVGYGESRPLVKNDSLAHKQINRRVEFKIIK